MDLKRLTLIMVAVLVTSMLSCGDDPTGGYSTVFDKNPPKPIEKKQEQPNNTPSPVKKKNNPVIVKHPEVDKKAEFYKMLLTGSEQWLEVVNAVEETVNLIYSTYFKSEGSYGELKSGQNLQEIYDNLDEKAKMPKLVYFKPTNFTLSKLMPSENRLIFNVVSDDNDSMKFDICPKWTRISYPSYIEQIRNEQINANGYSEYTRDFDRFLWLEARMLLFGMQLGFKFFLFENKYTEFDNITYPLKLSDLAQLIEYDESTFRKLRFFKDTDFMLANFNFKSREFLMTAGSTGKFPSPKSGSIRNFSRAGWYPFKPKVVEPMVKLEDENKPENKEKVKVENPDDDDEGTKPKGNNPQRLPSIKGKKVKLEVDYNFNLLRKKNFTYEKILRKIPDKPYDYEDRFEKVLENMGAEIVKSGYDAKVVVEIDIEVDLTTWMEEVFNLKLYGKMKVTSKFGDKENSFNGSFNERDNELERCFKSIWDDSEAKFKQIVEYAFLQ